MFFFFQAEDGIRDIGVTGVQTCALPIFPGVTAETVARAIEDHGHKDVTLVKDLAQIPSWLESRMREGDMVITMGAGSVTRCGEEFLKRVGGAGGAPRRGTLRIERGLRRPGAGPTGPGRPSRGA